MKTTLNDTSKQFNATYCNTARRSFHPRTGVRVYDIYYYSNDLKDLIYKLPQRQKLEIRINDMDLGHIYIFSPDNKIKYKVFAYNFKYADGLSLKQHKINRWVMNKNKTHKYYLDILRIRTSTSADNPEIKRHLKEKIERFLGSISKINTGQDNQVHQDYIINCEKKLKGLGMTELVVDSGIEFHNKSFEDACFQLGIDVLYAQKNKGLHKGKVERFLCTLNKARTNRDNTILKRNKGT